MEKIKLAPGLEVITVQCDMAVKGASVTTPASVSANALSPQGANQLT